MTHRLLLRSTLSMLVLIPTPLAAVSLDADAELPAGPVFVAEAALLLEEVPAEIEAMVVWAVSLFEEADMELPPITVRHHGDDQGGCGGHGGLHHVSDGRSVIDLCRASDSFATRTTLLHEFAHAWIEGNVGTDARAAFQELRGYDQWLDYDAAIWHQNGTEQAAEIVVWGLVDRPMGMSRITQNSCDELEAGYVTLTGMAPFHGFRDLCDA